MTELEQLEDTEFLREAIDYTSKLVKDGGFTIQQELKLKEVIKAARAHAEALKQKPVAYLYPYGMGEKELFSYQKLDLSGEKPLYAAPPVTQDAAREPLKLPCVRGGYTCFNDGWNACIEETKRLNGVM